MENKKVIATLLTITIFFIHLPQLTIYWEKNEIRNRDFFISSNNDIKQILRKIVTR
jgi:hypothetical protein